VQLNAPVREIILLPNTLAPPFRNGVAYFPVMVPMSFFPGAQCWRIVECWRIRISVAAYHRNANHIFEKCFHFFHLVNRHG
jgi:hypothetical protein